MVSVKDITDCAGCFTLARTFAGDAMAIRARTAIAPRLRLKECFTYRAEGFWQRTALAGGRNVAPRVMRGQRLLAASCRSTTTKETHE